MSKVNDFIKRYEVHRDLLDDPITIGDFRFGENTRFYSSTPFFNCQSFVIGNFAELYEDMVREKLTSAEMLDVIDTHISEGYHILLIDVNSYMAPKVRTLFKDYDIMLDHPYKSTNGSDMVLFQIKISEGEQEDDDDYEDDYDDYVDDDDYIYFG